jgi:hypothetical protein
MRCGGVCVQCEEEDDVDMTLFGNEVLLLVVVCNPGHSAGALAPTRDVGSLEVMFLLTVHCGGVCARVGLPLVRPAAGDVAEACLVSCG